MATLGHWFGTVGDRAHEVGMQIVYHHHMGTGVQTTAEIDKLMAMTDPDKVSLLFDTDIWFYPVRTH